MSETATPAVKAKKSVALSGVTAGNTALCTVGRTGNDLHYRGYDILDIAEVCEFEEIAHLLVHGKLPTRAELKAYKAKLKALRGLPASVKDAKTGEIRDFAERGEEQAIAAEEGLFLGSNGAWEHALPRDGARRWAPATRSSAWAAS